MSNRHRRYPLYDGLSSLLSHSFPKIFRLHELEVFDITYYFTMSRKYNPLPIAEEEDIVPSRDSSSDSSERTLAGSGENEKWEPQRPSGSNKRRGLRDLANSNWAWLIQTGMLSISVTLFVIQYLCSINTGDHNYMRVPMTWCRSFFLLLQVARVPKT
jgi:hypothetical protein